MILEREPTATLGSHKSHAPVSKYFGRNPGLTFLNTVACRVSSREICCTMGPFTTDWCHSATDPTYIHLETSIRFLAFESI